MTSSHATAKDDHHGHAHDEADDGAVHAHVSPFLFYCGILGALLFLTIVTVAASRVDFGSMNTVIAIGIATIKASLVAAFFMHLRHDKLFNTLAFLSAFLFLAIFLLLTYDDLAKRHEVDEDYGGYIDNGVIAPGGLTATPVTSAPPPESPAKEAPQHH